MLKCYLHESTSTLGVVSAIMVIILLIGSTEAASYTVCQGCEHGSIQSAIDIAKPGDIIEIHSGTYYEHLNISKPLRLIGVDSGRGRPVVDGEETGIVAVLSADGITLEGIILRGSGISEAGVRIHSNGNILTNNDISHHGADGISLERSSNNLIANNTFAYNGRDGVNLVRSNNNIMQNNTASYNARNGFYLESSNSNAFKDNTASENKKGFSLDLSSNNLIGGSDLKGNKEDGISLVESNANVLIGNNASYGYNGIKLLESLDNRIEENFAGYNGQNGIRLVSSSGNLLSRNSAIGNSRDAYDDGEANRWHSDGGMGNYYGENTNCTDLDGNSICDQPYPVPGGRGLDGYPLGGAKARAEPPSEGVLFLEVWTREKGEILEGMPMRMMIDFPTYRLSDGVLKSMRNIELPSPARALVGSGLSLSGDLGGGASSSLHPVMDLPYSVDNVSILSIDGDMATISYMGEQRTLRPGESWEEKREEIRSVGDARLKVAVNTTISNHGFVMLVGDRI